MNKFKILVMIMLLSCNNYSDDNYQPINNSTDDNTIYVTSSSGNSYNSTPSNNSDYFLSGNDKNGRVSGGDPSISFTVDDVVTFDVSASGHPFYIKTVQGTGTENLAENVNNNGTTNGTIRWTPNEPGTYYYQCSVHNNMYGIITIVE